jgi:hypothetical protein
MSTGRNDPCPCGSGKKFKVCCIPLGRRQTSSHDDDAPADPASLFHEMRASSLSVGHGVELAELRAAAGTVAYYSLSSEGSKDPKLGPLFRAADIAEHVLEGNDAEKGEMVGMFFPRLPFDVVVGPGRQTAADRFLLRHGPGLPAALVEAVRALIEAEDTVCRVVREKGTFFVEDLRTGLQLRTTDDVSAGTPCFICRLVRYRGLHVPIALEPVDAADASWLLGRQDEAADAAEVFLRDEKIQLRSRYKGAAFGEEILMLADGLEEEEEEPAGSPAGPDVRNTDGDPLVFTTLQWDVADDGKVQSSLARVEGLDLEETDGEVSGTFVRKKRVKDRHVIGESVSLGRLSLKGGVLTVETNSVERGELLRKKLDRALGKAATLRTVTSEPLEEALKRPVDPVAREKSRLEHERLMATPEIQQALEEMGRSHSLEWCDTVIPALGNRRPRSLVKTESGRRKVEAILEDFERRQAAWDGNPLAMDLDLIRRELGLPIGSSGLGRPAKDLWR